MIQVSTCRNVFTSSCVIAQNYIWGSHVVAQPQITWYYNNEKNYYIRGLAGNLPTQFSMEMQFVSNNKPFYYNWTTNYPFSGSTVNNNPSSLYQYWKARAEYNVCFFFLYNLL